MGEFSTLLSLDIKSILFGAVVILAVIKYIWGLIEWIINKSGIELKGKRVIKEDHDVLLEAVRELGSIKSDVCKTDATLTEMYRELDERFKNSYSELMGEISILKTALSDMQEKADTNHRATLKARIANLYRKHSSDGYWTKIDQEVFEGLIKDYEEAGGDNSFVHTKCVPESYTWELIEDK